MLRVRTHEDGSLWIPRADPETEAHLDALYSRWKPGALRWIPGSPDRDDWTDQLEGLHFGRRCVLVGKGPSLDQWTRAWDGSLVACLNESALVVPAPDFVFFVDPRVGRRLSGLMPFTTIPVRPPAVAHLPELATGQVGYVWRWTDGPRGYGVPSPYATAPAALAVLARWGVRDLLLVGFDGYDGDHAPDGGLVYARVFEPVDPDPRENADYALINRQIDEVVARHGLRIAWFHRGEGWEAVEGP